MIFMDAGCPFSEEHQSWCDMLVESVSVQPLARVSKLITTKTKELKSLWIEQSATLLRRFWRGTISRSTFPSFLARSSFGTLVQLPVSTAENLHSGSLRILLNLPVQYQLLRRCASSQASQICLAQLQLPAIRCTLHSSIRKGSELDKSNKYKREEEKC